MSFSMSRTSTVRLLFGLCALCLFWCGSVACTGTTIPALQHLKRPLSITPAYVNVKQCRAPNATIGEEFCVENSDCTDGKTCVEEGRQFYMYVANADLDRLTVVRTVGDPQSTSLASRELLLDPRPNFPSILYIPTGRYPVAVATAPEQNRLFVLHGIDGDIMVIDPRLQRPVLDDATPLRIPRACKQNNTCWRNPTHLVLYQESAGGRLTGFVAVSGENTVVAVDLTEKSPDFGKELARFPVAGTPSNLILHSGSKALYVTDNRTNSILKIDPKDLKSETIDVGMPTRGGAVSDDGKLIYLLEQSTGGILVFDLENKKMIRQGDERFPEFDTIQVGEGMVLSVQFLPTIQVAVVNENGETELRQGKFAWATNSDGYAYLLDIENHKVFNASFRVPEAKALRIFVGTNSFGDARDPQQTALPRIFTTGDNENETGIKLVSDRIRSEVWSLTYQGALVPARNGRFTSADAKTGSFVDLEGFDINLADGRVGDMLVLLDCKESATEKDDEGNPLKIACKYPITAVNGARVDVDLSAEPPPSRESWRYEIRTADSYLVEGSLSGRQPKRAQEGVTYSNDYFELRIVTGRSATEQDTRFQFETTDNRSEIRLNLGGTPSLTMLGRDRLPCTERDCNEAQCKTHPICSKAQCAARTSDGDQNQQLLNTGKLCNIDERCDTNTGACIPFVRLWVLDFSSSLLSVVNPDSSGQLSREHILR